MNHNSESPRAATLSEKFRPVLYSPVLRLTGSLLVFEALLLLVPLLLSLICGEDDWHGFLIAAAVSAAAGGCAMYAGRHATRRLLRRDGYLLITIVWILFSAVSMIPFIIGAGLDPTLAYFESMSGFTTTGATVISDVESLGHGLLLWRSIIQWIGGLGIVLFLVAVLPSLNDSGGIALFNAEMTGITHDKLHPRIRQTAMSLWSVYLMLTVALAIFLLFGGMSLFDAVCQSLTTMATGGFSTRNAGIAAWDSPYIASVMTVFMTIGGMNFVLIYNALRGQWRQMWRNTVLRAYLIIIAASYVVIAVALTVQGLFTDADAGVVAPLFHIASTITSTGFGYGDFSAWGPLAVVLTIALMMTGACAGSTTGAIKIDRVVAMLKNIRNEIYLTVYPKHVMYVKLDGTPLSHSSLRRMLGFVSVYCLLLVLGAMLMSGYGYEIADSLFASASCIGNNGLGYGATASGFGSLPAPLLWFYSALMLIGRLEVFTVFALFIPGVSLREK